MRKKFGIFEADTHIFCALTAALLLKHPFTECSIETSEVVGFRENKRSGSSEARTPGKLAHSEHSVPVIAYADEFNGFSLGPSHSALRERDESKMIEINTKS